MMIKRVCLGIFVVLIVVSTALCIEYAPFNAPELVDDPNYQILVSIINNPDIYTSWRCGFNVGLGLEYHETTSAPYEVYWLDSDGKRHGTYIKYYDSKHAKIAELGCYNHDKEEGFWIYKSENGAIKRAGFFDKGNCSGYWVEWATNGDILLELNYKNGKLDGFQREYLGGVSHYRSAEKNYEDGRLQGDWIQYDRFGKVLKIETYDYGVLISTKDYH